MTPGHTVRSLAAMLLLLAPSAAEGGRNLLENGAFRRWKAGVPSAWQLGKGAGSDGGPRSSISKAAAGGVVLRGDAATRHWQLLSQGFPVEEGMSYRIHFVARARDLRREAGQFQSSYVGMAFFDAAGRRVLMQVRDVDRPSWSEDGLILKPPAQAVRGQAMIFLAKSGILEVRQVEVAALGPGDSFDILVEEMDRSYSYFHHRKIDWKRLTARHRRDARGASTPEAFAAEIRKMLSRLEDWHVFIDLPGGKRIPTWAPRVERNHDHAALLPRLRDVRRIGAVGLVARTTEGFGYVRVDTLTGAPKKFEELREAMEGVLDAPGLIIDLRSNGGGNEAHAQQIAAIFTGKRLLYAKSLVRSGPDHNDFSRPRLRYIQPRRGKIYERPMVCLIGRGCMSSGEGFALMMKALPQATLVGQPTRGASGNPQPLELPNGVTVHYSRWVALEADGGLFEGRGIAPDILVEHRGAGDPTFDAGIEALRKRLAGQ
ncbi:MAG: S41 family peptidase [Planctomycetota bacterium]